MGTITTTPLASATAFGNQRKTDRCQNGVQWKVLPGISGTGFTTFYSTDAGATWTQGSVVPNGSGNSSSNSYTQNASLFIDVDDYASVVFKDTANGYLYYVRGTPNAARTAYTWSAATAIVGDFSSGDYPDIVMFRNPSVSGAWLGYVVYSETVNSTTKAYGKQINVAAGGTVTVGAQNVLSASLVAANSNPAYASIDFNHTGDGKTVAGGLPHLYVGWSAGTTGSGYGIRFRKATYSAGSWTWSTEREIDNTQYLNPGAPWLNTLFDGTRVVLVGCMTSGQIVSYDRDAADTTTTPRINFTPANNGQVLYSGSASYDSLGNLFLFGQEIASAAGSRDASYRKWDRASGSLGPRVTVDSTSNANPYFSARRGYAGQAIDYVYTDGTASPYTVTSGRIVLNQNPTAPTQQSPADNSTWDSSTDQNVVVGYSDPDGNPASKVRVYYRPKGTSASFAVIEQNTTAASGTNITVTIPAGTWPGEISHYEQVADSSGAWSDPSPSRTVTGIPAGLAAATGGGGGTAFSAWTISNATENARIARIGARALTTTVTAVSPLTITVDGGPVTALRNAGYTPTQGDVVQAEYISGGWIIQDKVVS